jgi:acetylornithine deacetylase
VWGLIADMAGAGVCPENARLTDMVLAIANKGVYRHKCCVRGKEAHSRSAAIGQCDRDGGQGCGKVRDLAEAWSATSCAMRVSTCRFPPPASASSGGIADNVVPRTPVPLRFRDLPTADAHAMQQRYSPRVRSSPP